MDVYEIDRRYWILKHMSDTLGGRSVPGFYYGIIQLPSRRIKRKLIRAAKRLGLCDLTNKGTLRLAVKYGPKDFERLEVYMHTKQEPQQYGINKLLVCLDTYHGSEREPTKILSANKVEP